jgi:putative transposase
LPAAGLRIGVVWQGNPRYKWDRHRSFAPQALAPLAAVAGPVYQGRFKSFPVQEDDHLLTVGRYVERNALRAGLVRRAENWRWSSLWQRGRGRAAGLLDEGPVALPDDWPGPVHGVQTEAELAALRRSVVRGSPFGDASWVERTADRLGLGATLRPQGRPRKETAKSGE